MKRIRLGTRKSALAMAQAAYVADRLKQNGYEVEIVGLVTEGDRAQGQPASSPRDRSPNWGKGVFVKALDEALIRQEIDLAVHSAKDVPSELASGLAIAAVPTREDVSDLLISLSGWPLDSIPPSARIGTSSLRRMCQLKFIRADLRIDPISGNIDTRLSKVGGDYDAVVLAAAGINRLGGDSLLNRMNLRSARLSPEEFLPAPGQGALAVVSKQSDSGLFSFLSDADTVCALDLERSLVRHLGADCNWPLGARAVRRPDGSWSIAGALFSVEGKLRARAEVSGGASDSLAKNLADLILDKGGRKILSWNHRKS